MITTLYRQLGIEQDLLKVQDIMRSQVNSSTPFIRTALEDMLEQNGKMLRPALLLLSSKFGIETPENPMKTESPGPDSMGTQAGETGGASEKILTLAAAVEMLHTATLIHDDIIDQAPSRRGIPTLHTLYGSRNAVLLGDFLFTRSFRLASDFTDMETGRYIAGMISSICESEIRQHETSRPSAITFREYHRRIMGKTAALFALSAYIGAYESGTDERNCRRLRKIGANIGAGFQIIDDILDFSGPSGNTGKSPGADIRQGIVNLPLLLALQNDTGNLEQRLSKQPRNGRRMKRIITLTRDLNGLDQSRHCARNYTDKALSSVALLPETVHRIHLKQFISSLLEREY